MTDPTGPFSGSNRVIRGGGWFAYARQCRSAYRSAYYPGDRSHHIGFRLAREGPAEITIMLPGNVPLELVKIPKGTFAMGSPENERGRGYAEGPRDWVTLTQDYYIGKTEVTQRQWVAVMGSNSSYFTGCGLDCPVKQVSWNDICGGTTDSSCTSTSFIGKVNTLLRTSKFRLPTEAEWERAARGGTTGPFSFDTSANPSWDTE